MFNCINCIVGSLGRVWPSSNSCDEGEGEEKENVCLIKLKTSQFSYFNQNNFKLISSYFFILCSSIV